VKELVRVFFNIVIRRFNGSSSFPTQATESDCMFLAAHQNKKAAEAR
jgi:hypothetical protein